MKNFVKLALSIGFIAILFSGCANQHAVFPLEKYSLLEDEQRQILSSYCEKSKGSKSDSIYCSYDKMTITSKKYSTDKAIIAIKENTLDVNCPNYCNDSFYSSLNMDKLLILSRLKQYSTDKPILSKYIDEETKITNKPTIVINELPKNGVYNKLVKEFEDSFKFSKSLTPLSAYVEYEKNSYGEDISPENLKKYLPIATISEGVSFQSFHYETGLGGYKERLNITKNSYNNGVIKLNGTLYYNFLNKNSNLNFSNKNVSVKYYASSDNSISFNIDNLTNKFMEIDSISVYFGDKVYSKNINVKLPPNATNYSVLLFTSDLSDYTDVYIKTFNESRSVSIGLDYSIQGKKDTFLQTKTVKVPNSI